MSKTSYTCTGCVPIDKSIVDTYVALLNTEASVKNAEDSRQEAEGQGDYSDATQYPNTRRAKEAARQTAEANRVKNEGSDGPDSEGYNTSRIKMEIDRQSAETQRQTNEGIGATDAECAAGSRRKNESIRQANEETRQSQEETRQAQEGTPNDEASASGSRWARYKYAEAARQMSYETDEGAASDAASATGSRWARYNKAEADRETAYDTAEASRTAGMAPLAGYYGCATAASTAAKEVAATNYVLTNGGSIKVKFTYANSASSPTLNINSTGAKAIVYNGAAASASNTWAAGDVVEFYYDPTYNSNAGAFVGIPTVVTVSQNIETGHTDIIVGSTTTPVASVAEVNQLGQSLKEQTFNIFEKTEIPSTYKKSNYYLKSDGTLVNANGWYTFDKIPVKRGDVFVADLDYSPSVEGAVSCAIFDAEQNVIATYNIPLINHEFIEDGYVSFCYDSYASITYELYKAVPISVFTGMIYGHNNNFKSLTELSYPVLAPKEISDSFKERGYLKTDGTITSYAGWTTYNKIPISAGSIFNASFGTIPSLSDACAVVVFDSEENVVATYNSNIVNIIFDEDGYVSFCLDDADTNTFIIKELTPLSQILFPDENDDVIKWCAIGDSITAGNTSNTGTSYATKAKDMYGDSVTLQKLGFWGEQMKNRLATTAFDQIESNTQIVTVNFGMNDMFVLGESGWGDIDVIIAKNREDLQDNVSTFESLRLFIEKMREQHPTTLIYFISPIKHSYSGGIQERFVEQEKKICNYYGIPVLDAFNESGIRYTDYIYTDDGMHPNEDGKVVFARWLVSQLNIPLLS